MHVIRLPSPRAGADLRPAEGFGIFFGRRHSIRILPWREAEFDLCFIFGVIF